MLYDLFPGMTDARLFPLAERFAPMLTELTWFAYTFRVLDNEGVAGTQPAGQPDEQCYAVLRSSAYGQFLIVHIS